MEKDLSQLDTEQLLDLLDHDPEAEASDRRLDEALRKLRELAGETKTEKTEQSA